MHVLSFQFSALGIGLFLIGLGVGWWGVEFFQRHARSACYQELVRLRYAHQRLQQDFNEVTQQASNCETEKTQALSELNNAKDLQHFEQLRLELMDTRNQLRNSTHLLAKREQQLRRLSDLAKLLRKQVRPAIQVANQASLLASSVAVVTHDLTCIEDIDTASVQKLYMLGILNCEQLAACSTEQLRMIQRLLSEDRILPLAKWVKAARLLTQQAQSTNSLAN